MSLNLEVKKLSRWYEQNKRELPWRKNKNPYFVWISEVMLQQTTVAAVIPYFERFIKNFPTVQSLAEAPLEKVLENWAGLGYYSRARNLHKSAIYFKQNGFLQKYEELIELPGFGPYTARAVSSIVFEQETGVIDGNVIRVLSRMFGLKVKWWESNGRHVLQEQADQLVKYDKPSIVNQALMELGATVCTPDKPLCVLCPWSQSCVANKENISTLLPLKKPKKKMLVWQFEPYLLEKNKKLLFIKNANFPFLKKIWFLPGKIKVLNTKPKAFLFKHSITNNYIYVTKPKKFIGCRENQIKNILSEWSLTENYDAKWIVEDEVYQFSPSSMTKKILESR
ncbi:MAG: A/G-specific adenine glycosylase [Bdellovibrionaceae bacterium]|nr:A/G-specific adenine glycosylase [Pseudobdellovibrionaceae bacterium]NUM57367.1 A/G-specific adenine glycosylase [Pseudobdellovibrionaceae bacterium]